MLTDLDRAIIDFAARHYEHAGAERDAVQAELGMSHLRYTMRLRDLVSEPAAWEYRPAVMRRMRERLMTRRRSRRIWSG